MDMGKVLGRRDEPLDALRGLAIFGMVLVNLQGSEEAAFPWLIHADWHGLTIADLVFPLFLLAVGLSLPLAQDGRVPKTKVARIVQRSALLWLIGFGIGFLVHASIWLKDIRFTGVLERIGIVYLVCALTVRSTKTWKAPAIAAAALLVMHGALLFVPAPGELVASVDKGAGLSAWLDRAVLGGTRMYGKTFDPEGPLSTLSAIATAMIGVAVQRMAMRVKKPMVIWVACTAMATGLALLAWSLWPVNKALWTPSFALANAAIGLGLLAVLKAAWPRIGMWPPVELATTLGGLALTFYVVHALLTAVLVIPVNGKRLWLLSFEALSRIGLPPGWTSLLFAMIGGALAILITLALNKRGWVLRV